MKTDIVFENLKVGQKLYSLNWGECELSRIDNSAYPIIITLKNGNTKCFSSEGYYYNSDINPTLFLTNPFDKIRERVIEVWEGVNWVKRVCIKSINEFAVCWNDAETIEEAKLEAETSCWNKWRELQLEVAENEKPKEITLDGVEYILTPKVK